MTEIERLRERVENLEEALLRITQWSEAYPTNIFHEPQPGELQRAHLALRAKGMNIDCLSAHAMRHALKGVGEIAKGALNTDDEFIKPEKPA